jgi:hypothetical protein
MKLALKTIAQSDARQRDSARYVRKGWSVYLAYYLVISAAIGIAITAALLLIAFLDDSTSGRNDFFSGYARFLIASAGVLAAIPFLIQLVSGPFVLTRIVVCRRCCMRSKVKRIAFFKSKHAPPVRCECGGRIEPAFLWKLDSI